MSRLRAFGGSRKSVEAIRTKRGLPRWAGSVMLGGWVVKLSRFEKLDEMQACLKKAAAVMVSGGQPLTPDEVAGLEESSRLLAVQGSSVADAWGLSQCKLNVYRQRVRAGTAPPRPFRHSW